MRQPETTPNERKVAIARLNARQNRRGVFTNIGEREVRREVLRFRKADFVLCPVGA